MIIIPSKNKKPSKKVILSCLNIRRKIETVAIPATSGIVRPTNVTKKLAELIIDMPIIAIMIIP
ncbi:MAG: hypothetical protein WCO23_04340 [bacterium]